MRQPWDVAGAPKRASPTVDALLVVVILVASMFFWVAASSIPVEDSHEIGNDADFDRFTMPVCGVAVVVSLLALLLRRPIRRSRTEVERDAELEALYHQRSES